jgi:transketolase
MRTAFIDKLCHVADRDERIWLLTGDLGFNVVEKFAECWPQRYVNVGIAEQNMMGVAAGLASCGNIVFIYSIANFPTFRCLEQLRNDVAYHNLNVKVVSVGAGFAYGTAGYTHHGVEDLALMRALPGMTVICPGDPIEAALATEAITHHAGPAYLRLGKSREPILHRSLPRFEIGKSIRMLDGKDVTLIATGSMLKRALETAERLHNRSDVDARVLSMPTVKPLDEEAIRAAACETKGIVVLEEHRVIGGLGSAVADVLSRLPTHAPLRVFGVPDQHLHEIGSQEFLVDLLGSVTDLVTELVDPPIGKPLLPPVSVHVPMPPTAPTAQDFPNG